MNPVLVAPSFLFRFSAPCYYQQDLWSKDGANLTPRHALTSFAALNGGREFAQVRMGWSEQGLAFRLTVKGKSEPPVSYPARLDASDAFGLWIDTRNTSGIHRASRFCHRFLFLPDGGDRKGDEAYGFMLRINRAKDDPKTYSSAMFPAKCSIKKTGYVLDGFVPSDALSGFDPVEYPRLGFFYAVADRELGWNTWSHGPEFPFAEDPSLWGTLELTK